MPTTNDRVIDEALSLPSNVRLSLVERLLTSLNLPIDKEINRLWAEEAERRVSQIEGGKAKVVEQEDKYWKEDKKLDQEYTKDSDEEYVGSKLFEDDGLMHYFEEG